MTAPRGGARAGAGRPEGGPAGRAADPYRPPLSRDRMVRVKAYAEANDLRVAEAVDVLLAYGEQFAEWERATTHPARMAEVRAYADAHGLTILQAVDDLLRAALKMWGGPFVPAKIDAGVCTCLYSCADDPAEACSLSGDWHVHPQDRRGVMGPCPEHPDAPGDH